MTISTKICITFFVSLLFVARLFAQSQNPTWEQLSQQATVNFKEVQAAFERDYPTFKANWDKQKMIRKENLEKQNIQDTRELEEESLDPMLKQFKKWEWQFSPKFDKNGIYDKEKDNKSINEYALKLKNSRAANIAVDNSNWLPLGPFRNDRIPNTNFYEANIGRIECVIFHPTNPEIFYIASVSSGVWKTIDGGKTWQFLSASWDRLNYGRMQLVMNPSNPNIIFAIVGQSYYYKTLDGGATWTLASINIPNYGNAMILNLYIDSSNPNNIIVSSGYPFYMMKSTDGGQTWSTNRNGAIISSLVYQPNNTSVVYISNDFGEIYKSINGGDSYNKIFQDPDNNLYTSRLAVTPAAPENIYYSSSGSLGTPVFLSINSGNSFNKITPNNNYWYNQGNYCHALAVSPTDPNDIWAGLGELQRTTNGGGIWNQVQNNEEITNIMDIHYTYFTLSFQQNTNKLFICSGGGLYRYNGIINNKKNFDLFSGYNTTEVNRIGTLENTGTHILFGAEGNGTHLLKGGKYSKINVGSGTECIINPLNTSETYSSYQNGNLFKNGSSISPNPSPYNPQYLTPWEMHPTNSQIMYASYNKMFRTLNGGNNWTELPNSPRTSSFKISKSNPNVIYATYGNYVYRTVDGNSWSINPTPAYPVRIAIDPINDDIIYITCQDSKVFKSLNRGVNWTNISGSLPLYFGVYAIAIDKNNTNDVYIGTEIGIFVWNSTINDWQYFDNNLPKIYITELEINNMNGGKIRAATYGRGIWESPLKTPCVPPSATLTFSNQTSQYVMTLQANTGAGLTYQWLKDGYTIVGASASSYITNSPGDYSVIVTYGNCSQESNLKIICQYYKYLSQAIYGPSANTDEYKAELIDATNSVQNNSVEYKASKSITLYPGFVINNTDKTSYFKAEINGCN